MCKALKIFVLLLASIPSVAWCKPNVILILTDDQGWGDIHSHGNALIDTPTMDQLAADGARFEHYYVSPMCAPTRASLLTGRWNLRTGASWVSHGKEILRLDEVTLGDAFKQAGYATGAFGKWHNGEYGPYHPNQRGFDQFVGFCRGAWENYFDAVIESNGQPLQTSGYITDVLTDAALAFMDSNKDKPFFCYIPYNAPHHPFQVPERYYRKYRERGFEERTAAVYGMVENIDDNLLRIIKKLDEWGIAEETIVVFTTDNGPTGPTRFNGNMKGKKATVDEGGVRVPLFMRWPGHIPSGRIIDRLAAHVDIFPTLVELCGIPMPQTLLQDGISMVPLLTGDHARWPDRMIFAHQNRFGETHSTPGAVRTSQFRLVNSGKGYELYDMLSDPGQQTDIAKKLPEVTTSLSNAYESWFTEVTAAGVTPPHLPVGFTAHPETALQGEDALLSSGLKFYRGKGWAHDSIRNWLNPIQDSVTWNIDVLQAGLYQVTLMYGCLEEDIGTRIRAEIGQQSREAVIKTAHDPMPRTEKGRNRNSVWTSGPVPTMTWAPLEMGKVVMKTGYQRLTIRLMDPKGTSFELKEAKLSLVRPD